MQRVLLSFLVALTGAEVVNPSPLDFFMDRQDNHSKMGVTGSTGSTGMQEGTKIELWSPSQPELTQMPSYPSMPNAQPFLPANHYLPGNRYSRPTPEYRSEHYNYPYESSYAYPISHPTIDTSLLPTTKHFVIVSFIGLILLFAIIQNSIASAKRKDALVEVLSNRRKRNTMTTQAYQTMPSEVESALMEGVGIICVQRTFCCESRKLHEDLGIFGKIFAKYLTHTIQNDLKKISPGWDGLVEDSVDAGLRGEDCDVIYKDCNFQISDDTATIDEEE